MSRCILLALSVFWFPLRMAATQVPDSTRRDSVVVLRPIQVSVTRAETPLRNVPYSIGVVSQGHLRTGRPALGLDESLIRIPGVFVSNRYNQSLDQRVSIRGFGARSAFGVRGVKILIDGIPQTLPDGQGQLTNLDLSTVSSIEVLRGSASALYGNASGGVIDIRTSIPNPQVTSVWGSAVGGAYGMFKWRGGLSAPIARGSFAIDGGRTISDGFRAHSRSDQWQLGVRAEREVGDGTSLLVTGRFADAPQLDNPGSLNQSELEADPSQASPGNVAANAGKAVSQGQFGVKLSHVLANGGSVEAMVFGLMRDLTNPLSFAYIELDRRAFGARAEWTVPVLVGSSMPWMTMGVDLQRMRDDRTNETPDRTAVTLDQLEHVTEVGPFVNLRWPIRNVITLNAGGRYDRVSFNAEDRLLSDGDESGQRTMSAFSGTLGVVYHAGQTWQAYANVSTSFETPTTTELVNQPTGPGGFNPELDPQLARTLELGLRGGVSDMLVLDVALFQSNVTDALIPFEVPTDPQRRFFRNAGSSIHRGFEASGTLRPYPLFETSASYTLGDYKFNEFSTANGVFDGNRLPGVPRHLLYHTARVGLENRVWIAMDNTVASGMFTDDANAVSTDGYHTLDLRGGGVFEFSGFTLSPFIGVLNLLDERYVGSAVVNAGFGRYFEPAPPRNAYVGMRVGWN
jgi:iron complex outermembrane receptor protein